MLASLFGAPAMQAVVSGQAAVGVAVSAIQLLSAFASVNNSTAGVVAMVEKAAEARTAFIFFALSTVFYLFSAGAYAWLMRTPEYRELREDPGSRRISLSMSQNFTVDGEGTGLVSGRSKQTAFARMMAMIKTNLAYNFTAGWVFAVTLVSKNGEQDVRWSDAHCSPCFRQSQYLCFRWILQRTGSSSVPFTFLSSTLEIFWVA